MAPPPNTPSNKPLTLHARYQAPPAPQSESVDPPTEPQHKLFSHPIPSSLNLNRGSDTPTTRTTYLSDLRAAVATVQGEINVFLTAQMEEDAKREQGGNRGGQGKAKEKEKEEEENYGEEVVEDED